MPVLRESEREAVQRRLDTELKRDVDVELYTQADIGLYIPGRDCRSCGPAQELVEEVSALSPKIHLKIFDFHRDLEDVASRRIDRIPALVIRPGKAGNVRYFGIPTGYEFALMLNSIVASSVHRSSLQLETRRKLKAIKEDIHIQVLVTPN